ncbi:DUF1834 family protein [Neisseriaceae bacterium ESL0693]|nr:DUF1834 family protein [Neisseriaceae bacterium ESL0693]
MISDIENVIIERLRAGLGKMVGVVKAYRGEFDNAHGMNATLDLPAVWVTYKKAKIKTQNTARQRYQQIATFNVMCVTQHAVDDATGQEQAIQHINSDDLVDAVLRLLAGQRLDGRLNSFGLVPKKVRTVLKDMIGQNGILAIDTVKFKAIWDFTAFEDGGFPEYTDDPRHIDWVFSQYEGQLSVPYPDLTCINSSIYDPTNHAIIHNDIKLNQED